MTVTTFISRSFKSLYSVMPGQAKQRLSSPPLSLLLELLRSELPILQKTYQVREIGIVGSYARNEQTELSDIDLVIGFYEPIGWDVVDLKEYLENLLSLPVDLILKDGLINRPRLFEALKRDVIYVTS